MSAKQYLRRIRYLDKTISSKLEMIETLHAQVTKTTSVLSETPKPQSPEEQDKLAATIAKIVDLKRYLRQELDEFITLKAEAIRLINSLEDSRHRLVLTYRYMNGYTWEQIAVCMHYTYQWVHRLHGQALKQFDKLLQQQEKS